MNGKKYIFRENKGFTLVEMLIVVAIIAVLIAISIPLVSGALDRVRHTADAANERAARGAVMVAHIVGGGVEIWNGSIMQPATLKYDEIYYYDAGRGCLANTGTLEGYGQCARGDHIGKIIALKMDQHGNITMRWIDQPTGTGGGAAVNAAFNGPDNCCRPTDVKHS